MMHRRWVRMWVGILVICCAAVVVRGQFAFGGQETKQRVSVYMARSALAPGESASLAVKMVVPASFHAQGHRPLDKNLLPTVITVEAVDGGGVEFGRVKYPVAKEIPTLPGLSGAATMAVYEGTVWGEIPVKVAEGATSGERTLRVTVAMQMCDEKSCLPLVKVLATVKFTVGAGGQGINEEVFAELSKQALEEGSVTTPSTATGGATTATMSAGDELERLQGMDFAPGNAEEGKMALWRYLVFALLGGAILNIMPCVLPVIPLKVMSLVQAAHGDRRVALLHAGVFALGIMALFVTLGLALTGYAWATNTSVVYGQQFQSAGFMVAMSGIVLALGLSMLGVWSINPPAAVYSLDQQRGGYVGSFMSGVLATLLATPCSAPFLGPVLAWAFTKPMWLSTSVLAVVGLGMAIPYVLLAVFPAGLNRLPRTGRWSELVKQFLGLVMIGVALYLVTTIPDAGVWPFALAAMLLVAMLCWAWGQIPTYDMLAGKVWTIRIVSVILAAGLMFGAYRFLLYQPAERAEQLQWEPFSVAALEMGLAEGRPVVVDWTATWCINCRFVEATVLRSSVVEAEFRKRNVLLLKADISSGHPTAELLLRKLDSAAIPLLAVFSPKEPRRPVVLRDLYSRERVINAVEAAGK